MPRNKYSGEENIFDKKPTITGPLFEGLGDKPIATLAESSQEITIRPSKTTAREKDREGHKEELKDRGNL